jgi:hypothetical protein
MKKHLLRISVFAAIAAAAAYAQSSTQLSANVLFDFVVGNQTLHAGQYTVDPGKIDGVVVIAPMDHNGRATTIAVPMYPLTRHSDRSLVFHRYGNTYFLSESWGVEGAGRELPKTNREREFSAKRLVQENTTVVASR